MALLLDSTATDSGLGLVEEVSPGKQPLAIESAMLPIGGVRYPDKPVQRQVEPVYLGLIITMLLQVTTY